MTTALITFFIDEQRFALPCSAIHRIIPMIEITSIPDMPKDIHGIINLQGKIIPVLNIRQQLTLSPKKYAIEDALLIAKCANNHFAMIVHDPNFVEFSETLSVNVQNIIKHTECIDTVIKDSEGIIQLLNIDKLYNAVLSESA